MPEEVVEAFPQRTGRFGCACAADIYEIDAGDPPRDETLPSPWSDDVGEILGHELRFPVAWCEHRIYARTAQILTPIVQEPLSVGDCLTEGNESGVVPIFERLPAPGIPREGIPSRGVAEVSAAPAAVCSADCLALADPSARSMNQRPLGS